MLDDFIVSAKVDKRFDEIGCVQPIQMIAVLKLLNVSKIKPESVAVKIKDGPNLIIDLDKLPDIG